MSAAENEIVLCPYNPEWKTNFAKEKELLRIHLDGEFKSIIHIGSTSIEGMDAKPIVDISVAVHELKDAEYYIDKLSSIGYERSNGSKFEEWILLRKTHNEQKYHVHVMAHDSGRLFKQVLFKVYMEENAEDADLYARKKKAFLVLDEHIWYSMNKEPFVDEVNYYALVDILWKPSFWKKRVQDLMGYIPFPEVFTATDFLPSDELVHALFKGTNKYEEYKKMFSSEAEYVGLIFKLLEKNLPIEKLLEITKLTDGQLECLQNRK